MTIKNTLAWRFLRNIKDNFKIFINTYVISIFTNSFAQFGEDRIIEKLLNNKKKWFLY